MFREKKKKLIAVVLSTALALSVLSGVFLIGGTKADAASSKKLFKIRTHTRKDCTSTPILAADQKGFFKEQGLQLVYTGQLKSTDILPAVLKGNNDFAETHPNALATYISGGAKIKGVARSIIEPDASVDPKYRHMWWFATKKSGIKKWEDLKKYNDGKQIQTNGLAPNCVTFVLSTIFDKKKLGRDRLKFINFDSDQAALQALQQGNIDIAGIHPPFYNLAQTAGLVKIGDSTDAGLGSAAGVYLYYFSDSFIKKNPEIVQKFVKAVTKAQVWCNAHPEESAKMTSKATGVNSTAVHYYSQNSVIPEKEIKPWIEDLINNGKLKKSFKISDIITHRFEVK